MRYARCCFPSLPILVLHEFCQLWGFFNIAHPLQYGRIGNIKDLVNQFGQSTVIKSFMDSPELNQFTFTQTYRLCVFQIFVSNLCRCMNGKYLLKSFKVWIKKKYFYFCKLLYYILLQFLLVFSVDPFLVLKNHCT